MKIEDLLGTQGAMLNVQNLNVIVAPEDKKELDGQIVVVPTENSGAEKDVVNPGIEYGDGGEAKWSPPLQQQLSVIKSAVGTTTDDTTVEPSPQEKDAIVAARNNTGANSNSAVETVKNSMQSNTQNKDVLARIKELAAIAVKQHKANNANPAKLLTRDFPSG